MTNSNGSRQTLSAYPTILAALKKNDEGMYEPSIAVESAPKFIKIPRSYNHYDSQRQYNVYQLYGFARHDSGIMYPVYVLVQPKGTKVSGGFMVTEYGRDDSTPSSTEYVVNQDALRNFVESADFINQLPAIKKNFGNEYAAILNDLRTEQTGGVAAAITDDDQAQAQTSMSVTSSTTQAQTSMSVTSSTTQSQTSTPTSTDSSEKSVTEQLVQHLKDSGFIISGVDENDSEAYAAEGAQFAIEPVSTETDDYEQRLQTILDNAPRNSKGKLLAPNDKPSNLPERLYAIVRTKEFKDWFGDWQNDPEHASKVVDKNGEPLVVYHNTPFKFSVFDMDHESRILPGMSEPFGHVGTQETANTIKGNQLALFLNARNPLYTDDFVHETASYMLSELYKQGIISRIRYSSLRGISNSELRKLMLSLGYDGTKYENKAEGGGISYSFISPNQIKLADGENTTFSRTNDNIHFFKDSKGVVYGYVDNAGIIHLDKNKIKPEHPIHEYTHIWDRVVALKNPSLWVRGVELMKQFNGGKLWNEIANSEFYGKKWSDMAGIRREFMIASEVHARLVGEGGAKLISEIEAKQGSSDIISKLKDWILKFWQSLKQTFSDWSKEDIEALTLKDFNHMTLRDFVISDNEVTRNETGESLSMPEKLEIVGLVNYSSGIEVSEDVQRAIDKINAIPQNEKQYITPVITGESSIPGVSLVDAINIAAKIKYAIRRDKVSDEVVREKISQVVYPYEQKALFDLSSFGTVPNNIILMLADYMNYGDTRGLVAQYMTFYLIDRCKKNLQYNFAIPIIESIDVKYDDSRKQSQFNDDIMKHCKGN